MSEATFEESDVIRVTLQSSDHTDDSIRAMMAFMRNLSLPKEVGGVHLKIMGATTKNGSRMYDVIKGEAPIPQLIRLTVSGFDMFAPVIIGSQIGPNIVHITYGTMPLPGNPNMPMDLQWAEDDEDEGENEDDEEDEDEDDEEDGDV